MQMTSLTERLLKQRVWSLSRHGCPPESYAGILAADNEQVQQEAVRLLKKEHQVLLWLETVFASRSSFGLVQGICDKLSASVHLIVSNPCRIMMEAFEAGGYKTASVAGRHLLNCLLCTFPDNKIVEDVHNDIRRDGKFQSNKKQTNKSIQDVTRSSQVFESRGIPHVKISRDEFVGDFRQGDTRGRKCGFNSKTHKMPREWHQLMARKTWGTLSEESLQEGAAAWAWLQHWKDDRSSAGIKIWQGVFNKLAPRQEVMKNLSDESFCFCLSSATWACIWWPVIVVDTPEANHCGALGDACFVLDAEGQADFMFIEQPEMWMVVETQPVCIEWQGGLRLARQSSGVERSLLRTFLTQPTLLGSESRAVTLMSGSMLDVVLLSVVLSPAQADKEDAEQRAGGPGVLLEGHRPACLQQDCCASFSSDEQT